MYRLLFFLSILPAIVILLFILKHDQENKEKGFLVAIFLMGVLSCFPAGLIELLMSDILLGGEAETFGGMLVEYFLIVAVTEELCKYFAMRIITWKNYRFNSTYDGIVYAVCSALGFATLENVEYVFTGDPSGAFFTAVVRAFMAVPSHAMYGIIWGYGYGIAKYRSVNNQRNAKGPIVSGLLIAMLYHGFYDFSLSAFGGFGIAIAIVIVIIGYIVVFGKAKKAAKDDQLFYSYMPPFSQNQVYTPYVPFYGRMQYPVNYQVTRPGLNPGNYYAGFRFPQYQNPQQYSNVPPQYANVSRTQYQNTQSYQNPQYQNSSRPPYQNPQQPYQNPQQNQMNQRLSNQPAQEQRLFPQNPSNDKSSPFDIWDEYQSKYGRKD